MAVRGVLLDLDGTLIDTNGTHVEAWRRSFADHGYTLSAGVISPQMGKGGDQLVPTLIGPAGEGKDGKALRDGHAAHYKELAGQTRLPVFPGAEALIADLRGRGVRVALATSSKPDHLEATFSSCGVDFTKLVDETTSAEEAEKSKPEPDLIHAGLAKLGLRAGECVLVGDTPYDGAAATKAGVRFWGVMCGGFAGSELMAAGAAAVFRDPADLRAQLDAVLAETPTDVPPTLDGLGV